MTMSNRASRRDLLRAALAAGLGLPAAAWLGAAGAAAPPPKRKLIVVWAQGGWDVTYLFDPKLGVPTIEGPEYFSDPADPDDVEQISRFGALTVVTNDRLRPSVSSFFARHHARAAIVNGVWVGSIAHDPCRLRMLTGTTLLTRADLVTITGAAHGADLPLGSVDLSGLGFTGSLAATAGSIGGSSQIKTLLDPTEVFEGPGHGLQYPLYVPTEGDLRRLRDRQLERHTRLTRSFPDRGAAEPRLADFVESSARAERLRAQAEGIVGKLALGTAPTFTLTLELAADLLQQEVCASVLVGTRLQWDTHTRNDSQHGNFEALFAGLSQLATMLEDRGLDQETTVVVLSEMTRTPRHNPDLGKDHWQHTSAMMFGAGVRTGQYGATDDLLESIPMDLASGEPSERAGQLCKYENLAAGVLSMLDVDPAEHFPGVTPFTAAKA